MLIEDVHWAEPTLLDLIAYVHGTVGGAPMLLICLGRPELLELRPDWGTKGSTADILLLGPLSESDSGALAGALVGMGLAGTSFTIVLAVMARLVKPERRTFVVGLGTAVTSLGQFVILPLGQGFISAYGWHTAAIILGCIALSMLPFSFVVRGHGRPPAGQPPGGAGEGATTCSFRCRSGTSALSLTASPSTTSRSQPKSS